MARRFFAEVSPACIFITPNRDTALAANVETEKQSNVEHGSADTRHPTRGIHWLPGRRSAKGGASKDE